MLNRTTAAQGRSRSASLFQVRLHLNGRYTTSGQKSAAVDPYVEVRAGAEVFRTPSVHGSHQPAWNWDFDMRLPAPIGTTRVRASLPLLPSACTC